MRGGQLGEDRGFFRTLAQDFILQLLHLASQHHLVDLQTNISADFARHQGIVAREDFYRHPVLMQEAQRFGGAFLRWVEKGDKP